MIVVDAGVAALWYLPQPLSDRAGDLLASDAQLVGPPLLSLEVGSAVLRAVRRGEISAESARRAVQVMLPAAIIFVPGVEESEEPFDLAQKFGGGIYDAVYLCLARRLEATLWTNDAELARTARRARVAAVLLGSAGPTPPGAA